MRAKTIDILKEVMKEGSAVGAFNTSNLEITQAIARAASKLNKPCVIQATVNSLDYVGDRVLGDLVSSVIENESNSTPIGFHLDHGRSLDDIMRAIGLGMDSVMIDASNMKLRENIEITKRIVEYAHEKNISVQADLGKIPYLGKDELEINWDEVMTNPEEAKRLVEETGVDALAVGIGNAHGFYRERSEPDWERLAAIHRLIPKTPLIIHGASDWGEDRIEKAVQNGACCFNIDTDIRIAFSMAICQQLNAKCDIMDPRKLLSVVREKVSEKVENKIKYFSRKNKG